MFYELKTWKKAKYIFSKYEYHSQINLLSKYLDCVSEQLIALHWSLHDLNCLNFWNYELSTYLALTLPSLLYFKI